MAISENLIKFEPRGSTGHVRTLHRQQSREYQPTTLFPASLICFTIRPLDLVKYVMMQVKKFPDHVDTRPPFNARHVQKKKRNSCTPCQLVHNFRAELAADI